MRAFIEGKTNELLIVVVVVVGCSWSALCSAGARRGAPAQVNNHYPLSRPSSGGTAAMRCWSVQELGADWGIAWLRRGDKRLVLENDLVFILYELRIKPPARFLNFPYEYQRRIISELFYYGS
jgi:hypothetical protein